MSVRVDWVPYGRAAADALRERIATAKQDDPLTPVTVVVPSNHVGVATRRLLASTDLGPTSARGAGLVAVSFVTPYRLAELLGAPVLAATGRRPVSTPVIAAALRTALAEKPGLFAPVADHEATETALVATYRELREVSAAGLDALAATSARAADVVRVHRATHDRLRREWYDEQDLMAAAAGALRDGHDHGIGYVLVFLPQRISGHSAMLFDAAAGATDVHVLAGATGDGKADAEVAAGLARLLGEVPPAPASPTWNPSPSTTRIVQASDADDEVRVAVRAVVDAVRAGTPLGRIALLFAGADPYARLAHEHLAAAGITVNGPAVVPLAGRIAGRALLDLLRLPESGFRRQDVLAWLNGAPVLVAGGWAPTVAWERVSRDAGVVAGRKDWDARLETFARDQDTDAERTAADPDHLEWQVTRKREQAERARRLRSFVLDLVDDLEAVARLRQPWGVRARWARANLDALLGGPRRREAWPDAERKAADRVDAALDRLAALDGVEDSVELDVFTRTLELELESDLGRVGRFGEGVLVGPISMGVGLDLDLVVVLGLAEGSFPGTVRDDSLLPDNEREVAGDDLPLRRSRVDREHRHLLATLAAANLHLLGYPRGDLRRSSERIASRWVLDIASELAGTRWWTEDLLTADAAWVQHTASFDAGLRTLDFPATEQEHHLRSLMVASPAGPWELVDATFDATLKNGATTIGSRRSSNFTRFDGNLDGLAIPSPVDTTTSATRIQRWAKCPFKYLLAEVLHVEGVENPEEALEMTALDRGSLVHEILERFIVEVLDRPEADRPRPDMPWLAADRARMDQIARECFADYEARGLTGRPIFWRREQVLIGRDLQRFLTDDGDNRREQRTRPVAAELAFGLQGAAGVPITLPDGRVLRFRGLADRVDVAEDGSLHIVDYKTGKADDYRQLSEENPDERGLFLQLPVYGLAARLHQDTPDAPVFAEYWFVSKRGQFRHIGYPVTDEVLAHFTTTLGVLVNGIESGVFAARPSATSSSPWVDCDACDPDALGVTELRGAWERKRHDPLLEPYASFAEPLPEDDDEEPADAVV
jgi:ATP-dependent helicase/nuclease subunit B